MGKENLKFLTKVSTLITAIALILGCGELKDEGLGAAAQERTHDSVAPGAVPSPTATPAAALGATPTPAPFVSSAVFLDVADSYAYDGYPDTNYGTQLVMTIHTGSAGYNRDAYFNIDLSKLSGTVDSAVLELTGYLSAAGTATLGLYEVPDVSWLENTLTWNNRPVLGGQIGSFVLNSTASQIVSVDLTDYVKARLSLGKTVLGLAIHSPMVMSMNARFNTKESGSGAPVLRVTGSLN